MFPVKTKVLEELKEKDISMLAELDRHGLIVAPGENIEEYGKRLISLKKSLREIENDLSGKGEYDLFGELILRGENRIPPEIMGEAAEYTENFYNFSIDWVPGFFLPKNLGMLWGGYAISFPDSFLSVFLIRKNFEKKSRWLLYKRDEILAHELCHIARMPFKERFFEELFAYKLSPSILRRALGNCFQNQYDAVLFILPILVLLFVQVLKILMSWYWLPVYPFWLLMVMYPLFLLVRNQLSRKFFYGAERNLGEIGVKNARAVLFRLTKDEIISVSRFKDKKRLEEWIESRVETELRWKVIKERFI